MLLVASADGGRRRRAQKVADVVCWNALEGRRCVRHAELAAAAGVQAVIVPIPDASGAPGRHDAAAAAAPGTARAAASERLAALLDAGGVPALLDAGADTPGAKFHRWERLGVPLRLEVGRTEAAAGSAAIALHPALTAALAAAAGSDGELRALLEQLGAAWPAPARGAPAQQPAAAGGGSVGAPPRHGATAVPAGARPVRLAGVPVAQAAAVCRRLLDAVAAGAEQPHSSASGGGAWPRSLPYGACAKLHLWADTPFDARPCVAHLQHLVGIARPCHCGAAPHVSRAELQAELQRCAADGGEPAALRFSVQRAAAPATAAAAAGDDGDGSDEAGGGGGPRSSDAVALFVSCIPGACAAASVRQALLAAFAPHGVAGVVAPAVGERRRSRGWARVWLQDAAAAAAALEALQGQLVLAPGAPPAQLSWCTGRADALFPSLPFAVRRRLRLDAVAAFSTTDGPTAAAIAALLAALALTARGEPEQPEQQLEQQPEQSEEQQQERRRGQLSVADLTACAGGSTAGFLGCPAFGAVTALELDPDRAEDLAANVGLLLAHAAAAGQAAQPGAEAPPQQAGAAPQLALSDDALSRLALLRAEPRGACGAAVAVACGDAVRLLGQLRRQDVTFLDPPWGGPNYHTAGGGGGGACATELSAMTAVTMRLCGAAAALVLLLAGPAAGQRSLLNSHPKPKPSPSPKPTPPMGACGSDTRSGPECEVLTNMPGCAQCFSSSPNVTLFLCCNCAPGYGTGPSQLQLAICKKCDDGQWSPGGRAPCTPTGPCKPGFGGKSCKRCGPKTYSPGGADAVCAPVPVCNVGAGCIRGRVGCSTTAPVRNGTVCNATLTPPSVCFDGICTPAN
ncbi:hypothetical protein HT031_006496 [Scenedesmus sp. PABB004]|nr:hypothetical protein HT031_006496 [Scenedesmus sp. PABB004]